MDKINENNPLPEPAQEPTLGRRDLLKALAAGGAAVTAASLLPGKWVKPMVEAGVLPAHAQTSDLAIANLRDTFQAAVLDVGAAALDVAYFDYTDGLCQVDENTQLFVSTNPPGGDLGFSGKTIAQWFGELCAAIVGTTCTGTIAFSFNTTGNPTELTVKIAASGRTSNPLSKTFSFNTTG